MSTAFVSKSSNTGSGVQMESNMISKSTERSIHPQRLSCENSKIKFARSFVVKH